MAGMADRWSPQPAALLSLPFLVLAAASLNANSPVGAWRWLGIVGLGTLSLFSLAAGFRRDKGRFVAADRIHGQRPPVDPDSSDVQWELALSPDGQNDELRGRFELRCCAGAEQSRNRIQDDLVPILQALQTIRRQSSVQVQFAADVPQPVKNIVLGESDYDLTEIHASETIESPLSHAQLKIAAALGAAAIIALGLVVFLLADQIHRSENVTPLGLGLGLALVLSPATLAAHVAMGRIRIRFDSKRLNVISRNGLLGTHHWEASITEVEGLWLLESDEGSPLELVVKKQDFFRSIPLWGSAQPHVRRLIHPLGHGSTDSGAYGSSRPFGTA
jgi:hypothetical protein